MQKTAIRAGLRLSEFWGCTPYQYGIYIEAWSDEVLFQQQRDVSLAWHVAAFTNSKRLKPLNSYLKQMSKGKLTSSDITKQIEIQKEVVDSFG